MAVKLRLTRVGKKKQPQYRIVAADSRSPRDGRFIQIVGTYNPRTEPSALTVDNEKAVKWLMDGAQPTERVKKLLEISGAWGEFDAVAAIYHDQGLAPLKAVDFSTSANLSLGLKHVRTSPDHGTAYEIAGQGKADRGSFDSAMRLARVLSA